MAESFESLLKSFRDVTHAKIKDNKDSAPIKLLTRTVKSLETVLNTLDKFLKTKGVDVGQAYKRSKDKAKSLADSGKKLMEETKEKGLRATMTGKALDIKSKLGNIFAGDKEKASGPPEEGEEAEAEEKKPSKIEKAKSTLNGIKDKIKDKLSAGGSPLEEKKSWLDRVKEKTANRKAEVENEKKSVLAKAGKGKGGGWLGKILSGVMSLGGMVVGGLTKSINFLGGFLLRGFSKALFGLVPSLAGGIARATSGIVTKGLALAGRGAMGAIGTAAKAALPIAGQALGMVARGAAMLATGPVGWAIAIGTAAYAGYKLYKYLTRNDVSSDIFGKLTRLRLLMYGVNDTNKEYYSKIFDLEMLMKDYVKFTNYQVQITKLDGKAIEKVLELFGVTREEKEKYAVLNAWFMKRFIPAYKAFLSALYSVNSNIYLDQIDKLKPGDLVTFISKFQIPGIIYNVTNAPTGDQTNILVKKEDVDALYTNICNEVKAKAPKAKTPEEKAREENRQAAAKQAQAAAAAKKAETPTSKDAAPLKKEAPVPMGKDDKAGAPDAEGENKPSAKEDMAKTQSKASGKLNAATGSLTPGGMSLEGISTKLDKSKIYNLDPNVRELFTGMAKEYHSLTGKNIPLNEAFRSYEDQAALYEKMPGKAAKPGNSTHEAGLAVDIASATSQELDKMGLLRKYGFSTSVGGEKWHLEPIGVSVNPTLAKKDENFRTKAVLSSPGKGGGGYGFMDGSILKKRNIDHQLSIYNSASDNPIDVEKVAEKTAAKDPTSSPTGAVSTTATDKGITPATTGPLSVDTSSKSAPQLAYHKKSPNYDSLIDDTKPADNYKAHSKSGSFNDSFKDSEGESKPSIPTTTTPFKPKENTPSLDGTKGPVINKNMDIGQYASLPTENAIRQAAKMSGMDQDTMFNFAKIESSLNPNAKAKTSSAGGLFQITDPTWEELMKKHAGQYNIPPNADKFNPFYNSLLAAEYSKSNLKRLNGWKQVGMDEPSALYLGHHFGVTGANKILNKANQDPDAHIKEAVSEDSYKANRQELGNNSVMGYLSYLGNKLAKVAGTIFKPKEYASKSVKFGDDPSAVKMTGNDNVAASTPPPPSIGKPSPVAAPMQKAKMSISTSSYASSMMNNASMPKESMVQDSMKQMFNSGKMETILSDQLTELRSVVTILRSIDGKVGTSPQQQAPTQKTPAPPMDRSIPNSSINLSRKAIQA